MKTRPSLLFWLGLPGFIFILWSWHDSMKQSAGIRRELMVKYTGVDGGVYTSKSFDFIGQFQAGLLIRWHEFIPDIPEATRTTSPSTFQIHSIHPGRKAVAFPPIPTEIARQPFPNDKGSRPTMMIQEIAIPHWLILLLYTLTWSGLIAWRKRRVKRLKQAATPEPSLSTDSAA